MGSFHSQEQTTLWLVWSTGQNAAKVPQTIKRSKGFRSCVAPKATTATASEFLMKFLSMLLAASSSYSKVFFFFFFFAIAQI